MKTETLKFRQILAFAPLFLLLLSTGASAQNPAGGIFDSQIDSALPESLSLAGGERGLLEGYLQAPVRVSLRDPRAIALEFQKLELQRQVFTAYNQRWWQRYADAERDARVQRYWDAYYAGQNHANELMSHGVGPNACRAITLAIGPSEPTPYPLTQQPNSPELNEAFHRGLVAAYPQCFGAPDLLTTLKGFDRELLTLSQRLLEIRKQIVAHQPGAAESNAAYDSLAAGYARAIDELITGEIPELSRVIQPGAARSQEITRLAQQLAQVIDCSHLSSRIGRTMSCAVPTRAALFQVDRSAAYKILLQGQLPGVYQTDVRLDGLFEAADTYLREVRPGDVLTSGLVRQLLGALSTIDTVDSVKFANYLNRFRTRESQVLREAELNASSLWKSYFSDSARQQMLDALFSLKARMEAYERTELGTDVEAQLLRQIAARYAEIVETAASIQYSVPLARSPIYFDLNDETETRIELPEMPKCAPAGYLLGVDATQVASWKTLLTFRPQY